MKRKTWVFFENSTNEQCNKLEGAMGSLTFDKNGGFHFSYPDMETGEMKTISSSPVKCTGELFGPLGEKLLSLLTENNTYNFLVLGTETTKE